MIVGSNKKFKLREEKVIGKMVALLIVDIEGTSTYQKQAKTLQNIEGRRYVYGEHIYASCSYKLGAD